MLKLTLMCSMCGHEREIEIGTDKVKAKTRLCEMVQEASNDGWLFQQNGEHYDTYCSNKCAE
jgi:uncharacterized protein (DUF169 family)